MPTKRFIPEWSMASILAKNTVSHSLPHAAVVKTYYEYRNNEQVTASPQFAINLTKLKLCLANFHRIPPVPKNTHHFPTSKATLSRSTAPQPLAGFGPIDHRSKSLHPEPPAHVPIPAPGKYPKGKPTPFSSRWPRKCGFKIWRWFETQLQKQGVQRIKEHLVSPQISKSSSSTPSSPPAQSHHCHSWWSQDSQHQRHFSSRH